MKDGDTLLGVAILIILIIVIIISPKGSLNGPTSSTPESTGTGNISKEGVSPNSPYAKSIYLTAGNASYVYQSYEEYITIDNSSSDPVNITGWKLKNGKGERAYNLGGDLRYFPSDIVEIGQGTAFVSPIGTNIFQNIVLKPYETAYVTTGSVGSQSPYKIVSFKENICSGYLEDLPEYNFTPPLGRNCPRPSDETGIANLDTECRKFIERMPSCRTPEFNTKDIYGEICYNCVDNTPLSSPCVSFIKNHFNYSSCILYHTNDTNFSGRIWRVFLGRGWEMWAKDYESIDLFDQLGRLVTHLTY